MFAPMLKTAYIMLIAALALAAALAVQFATPEGNARYIGSDRCASCHESRASGSAFERWRSGPHSRAYDILSETRSIAYRDSSGTELSDCLPCHTTIGREVWHEGEEKLLKEGVGCERCHGPGSEYTPSIVMRDAEEFRLHGGSGGSLQECGSCHRTSTGNDVSGCPVDTSRISPIEDWRAMGHSGAISADDLDRRIEFESNSAERE